MEEHAFDPSSYDPASPAAFYQGDEEEVAELANSVWLVQGTELPVCRQVVAHRSAVLRGAYRAERESAALQASRQRWATVAARPCTACAPC